MGEKVVEFPDEVEQGPGKGDKNEYKIRGSLGERKATRHRVVEKGAVCRLGDEVS